MADKAKKLQNYVIVPRPDLPEININPIFDIDNSAKIAEPKKSKKIE